MSNTPPSSLATVLATQLRQNSERTSFIFLDETCTEHIVRAVDVDRDARRLAQGLVEASVDPGDLLLLSFAHGYDLIVAFLGALYAGVIPAVLPPAPAHRSELDHQKRILTVAEATDARAILTNERWLHAERASLLNQAGYTTLSYRLAPTLLPLSQIPARTGSDTAFLQFSSGSTSAPKGIVIQNSTVLIYLKVTAQHLDFDESDVSVGWLPLNHDMGLMMQVLLPLFAGACSVLIRPEQWVRTPESLLLAIDAYRGTMSWMPNFGFGHCLRRIDDGMLDGVDLSSLRRLGSGGEPAQVDLLNRFAERFEPYGFRREALAVGYGMAEAVAGVTQTPHHQPIRAEHLSTRILHEANRAVPASYEDTDITTVVSCGTPKSGIEIRIVDEHRRPVPARYVGEISVRSPTLFAGYHLRPDLTALVLEDGWYYTGDLGYLADGELYVCGRKSDLIVLGGKNVYAHHLEAIAREILGRLARRVVAFGMQDEEFGTEVAILVCELREPLSPETHHAHRHAIRNAVRINLDVSLSDIRFVEKGWIIRTTSGKLARAANREKYQVTFPTEKTTQSDLDFNAESEDPFESKLRQVVAGIWREVLGIYHIDPAVSLLDLGGDSLQASRILTRLRERLSISVSLAEFLERPTVDGMVHFIVAQKPE